MQLFLGIINFRENFIGYVKEPLHFTFTPLHYTSFTLMAQQNSSQNVKGTKMVEYTKSYDKNLYKFNFGLFLSCLIVSFPDPDWGKLIISLWG